MKEWFGLAAPVGLFVAAIASIAWLHSCEADDCASRGGKLVQTGQLTSVCFEKGVVVE